MFPDLGSDLPPLTRNASDAAAELIKKAILDGRLQPGERLKEEELAAGLGISRTPVREALRILQTEGLLDSSPYQGTTVRRYALEELDELYQLRALLEGFAARRAARLVSDEDVERMRSSCLRFSALNAKENLPELVAENLLFHNLVLEAAQSKRLTAMVRMVIDLPLVYRSYIWYSPTQKRSSEQAHEQLTEALAAHDADRAESVMRAHIDEARSMLLDHSTWAQDALAAADNPPLAGRSSKDVQAR